VHWHVTIKYKGDRLIEYVVDYEIHHLWIREESDENWSDVKNISIKLEKDDDEAGLDDMRIYVYCGMNQSTIVTLIFPFDFLRLTCARKIILCCCIFANINEQKVADPLSGKEQ
jgi:hypothetical protein